MPIRKRRYRRISIDEPNETAENGRERAKIDPSLSPEKQVVLAEAVWRLHAEISRLPRVVRSVVEIRRERDEPSKETAAFLGISLSAAESRLMRARDMLHKSLTH